MKRRGVFGLVAGAVASCSPSSTGYSYNSIYVYRHEITGSLRAIPRGIVKLSPNEALMGRSGLLLKLELQSNPEILCVVRHALGQLAETFGFSSAEGRAVVLAVDEALTNIIKHAYGGEEGHPIQASFRRIEIPVGNQSRKALEIVLEDHGKKVDGSKLRARALEDLRPGGLGLHFINQCMDSVEFRRKPGKNQLRLIKLLEVPNP